MPFRPQKRHLMWLPVAVWLLQLELLSVCSLWMQTSTIFVERFFLGLDFFIFPNASAFYWRYHLDPYSFNRFVAPPFSLLIGRLAEAVGPAATKCMFVLDVAFILGALWIMARHFGVRLRHRILLMLAVFAFYPAQFLVERGNLDGIMLFLFALAIAARPVWLRSFLIALSINIKLYTVVAAAAWTARRNAKALAWTALFTVLLVLPFYAVLPSFLHRMQLRMTEHSTDNMSPSYLLGPLVEHHAWVRLLYIALWLASMAIAALRARPLGESRTLAVLTPWMAALPFQVWPYTGVMVLALYCAWMAEPPHTGPYLAHRLRDILLALGLALAGTQQYALNAAFAAHLPLANFFSIFNPLGIALLMAAGLLPSKAPARSFPRPSIEAATSTSRETSPGVWQ